MSILNLFFRNNSNSSDDLETRVKTLEERISTLEKAYIELSNITKKISVLSIKTSQELDNLAKFVKEKERKNVLSYDKKLEDLDN